MKWSKYPNSEKQQFIESLYRDNYDKVYVKVRSMCISPNQHDVEDCVQETFFVALKNYEILKTHPIPKAYILKTATNVTNNFNNRYNKAILKSTSIDNITTQSLDDEVEDKIIEQKIQEEHIYQKIMKDLTNEQQQLYLLYFVNHSSYDDIANLFGVKNSTIRMRVSRLRLCITNKIKKILK